MLDCNWYGNDRLGKLLCVYWRGGGCSHLSLLLVDFIHILGLEFSISVFCIYKLFYLSFDWWFEKYIGTRAMRLGTLPYSLLMNSLLDYLFLPLPVYVCAIYALIFPVWYIFIPRIFFNFFAIVLSILNEIGFCLKCWNVSSLLRVFRVLHLAQTVERKEDLFFAKNIRFALDGVERFF